MIIPSSCHRRMSDRLVSGRMVYNPDELKAWVTENFATLTRRGQCWDKDVYNEIMKIFRRNRTVSVIIPHDDAEVMEPLVKEFFRAYEETPHTVVVCRDLFEGVSIMIANSEDSESPAKAKAKAPPAKALRQNIPAAEQVFAILALSFL